MKVASPFTSPFAKTVLGIFWIAYVGMLIGLIVSPEEGLVIISVFWTVWLPLITWAYLSGPRLEPGRSVGGGPMYPKVGLDPGEVVIFQAPARFGGLWGAAGGHLFLTDCRIIALSAWVPLGRAQVVRLRDVTSVTSESKGWLWWREPGVAVRSAQSTLSIRPWSYGSSWDWLMGLMEADEFMSRLSSALESCGLMILQPKR